MKEYLNWTEHFLPPPFSWQVDVQRGEIKNLISDSISKTYNDFINNVG